MEGSPYNDHEREVVVDKRVSSSATIRQIMHYAQIFNSGVFKQYDWGSDSANIDHYGTKIIPLITLEKIKKVPIAFFVGKQDDLADPIDTEYVSKRISTLVEYKLID